MTENLTPDSPAVPINETDDQRHKFTYDCSESQPVCVSIIRAVASVSDVDPLSLQPRLYDVIDSDALETLLAADPTDRSVQVTFSFGAYEVTVTNDGEIVVREDEYATAYEE